MVAEMWKKICLFGLVIIIFSFSTNILFYFTINSKPVIRERTCNEKDIWKKTILSYAMQTDSRISEVLDVLHKFIKQQSLLPRFGHMTINSTNRPKYNNQSSSVSLSKSNSTLTTGSHDLSSKGTTLQPNSITEKPNKPKSGSSEPDEKHRQVCKQPKMELYSKDTAAYFSNHPDIHCNDEPSWIHFLDGGHIKLIIPPSKRDNGTLCYINYIFRKDDFEITYSKSFAIYENTTFALRHDFFRLNCTNSEETTHESFHAGVVQKKPRFDSVSVSRGLGYNVLIIGFDSVSRLNFERKCKESYNYLTKTMEANILSGYNIVGDGTPQALIPILTGQNELELPSVLKRDKSASRVDVYPFIWKDFRKNGYVTAFAEDSPNIGAFTYRMTGFSKKPTDHYMRPFYLAISPHLHKHSHLCLGSKRRSQIYLDWIQKFHTTYKKERVFSFAFASEFSHNEPNLVQTLDQDLLHLLSALNSNNQLENTILIIMSDHGLRFGGFRETVQGKMEERLPLFAFVFPKSFKLKHPKAFKNFRDNTKRLTTPYDIYYTLRDLIQFDGDGIGNTTNRGISLFKEIPLSRTCFEAGIESHWCTCLTWNKINLSEPIVHNAAEEIVDFINNSTRSVRNLCQEIKLQEILEAFEVSPYSNLLRFKKSLDEDGRIPGFSTDTNIITSTYQIVLKTEPGGGMFEATLDLDKRTNKYLIKLPDISRINKYGESPKCVEKEHENLRKYCVCLNN